MRQRIGPILLLTAVALVAPATAGDVTIRSYLSDDTLLRIGPYTAAGGKAGERGGAGQRGERSVGSGRGLVGEGGGKRALVCAFRSGGADDRAQRSRRHERRLRRGAL